MSNKKFDPFRKLEELPYMAYVLLAVLCIVVHVLLCTFIPTVSVAVCGLALTGIYLLASLLIHLAVRRRMSLFRLASNASEEQNNGVIYTFRHMLKTPYAVVTEKGKIVTVNVAMENIAGAKSTVFGADITDICGIPLTDLTDHANDSMDEESDEEAESIEILADKKAICHIGDRVYHIDCHSLHSKGKQYYLMMFNDITDLFYLNAKNRAEFTAVAYIVIDNLDEIAQYAKVSYQAEASQVDAILKQWAADMGGILREYDRYKYILLLTRHSMLACAKTKFEILDKIREIRLGDDNIPITVSMGMTTLGKDLAEREHEALICLDMALQRGGDQVVMKNEVNTFFFGGRTKSQQKRSGGQSRVIASKLCAMISASTNVLIMGHSNPDFDSIGACVGIASLCMHLGVNAKIVANVESENFKACTGRLIELADYKNMFVNSVEGLEEMEFGTLLIVVDANNLRILEAPEIANNAFNIAIIDHHIKKEEFEHPPKLTYIDPSASSACELVSEILEFSIPVGTLRKEEANVIMAGIMVDTQNFTRTVGTRTFAAALYLRGAGALPESARTFFEQGLEDSHSEALFGTNAQIYGEQIAITVSEGTGSPHDRVAAAKAADKLLSVKNVNAAFALVVIGESVHISGRSNGKINVQLILEKMGGGGHFDVAGAVVADSALDAAKEKLIAAIDEYIEETTNQK